MKSLKIYLTEKWLPREEWEKQQQAKHESKKRETCAFNDYEDVTQEMVDNFWKKSEYAENLVEYEDISKEWKPAYEKAKKNVAMLDYAMHDTFTIYFDKDANLSIHVNTGASWSLQNHLHHYADKCKNYFTIKTCANGIIEIDKWELLYDGDNGK